MKTKNEFHESYFQHTCLVIPEKDVLDTDIIGAGWIAHLKWWWHDLFLLSYTSNQSRGFYTSSHAMSIERFRQFRKYKSRIHPMSKFRNLWDFLILHTFIIHKILFRFTSTFIFDKLPIHLFYIGAALEIIIIADLFVNLMTGYIDVNAKRVILDAHKSLLKFCSQKMFIHIASAIPLHWLMFLRYGTDINCGLCKSNRFICALKFVSVFSLYRVFETSAYWTRKSYAFDKYRFYKFLRIAVTGLVTIFQFYDLSDAVVMFVFIYNDRIEETSTLALRLGMRYIDNRSYKIASYKYVMYEFYRCLRGLFLFSFGIKGKTYYLDKLSTMTVYLLSYAFYAQSIIECYSLVSCIMYSKDQTMKRRKNALNLISSNQLSEELGVKVRMYFDLKSTKTVVTETRNSLYKSLPKIFKREAKFNAYMKLILRIPLFEDWPLSIIEEIVMLLQKRVYLMNDIVALAWVEGEGMMIVDKGILAVYSQYHKETGHLIDGDYFGELSLVTDKELCLSYVVAVSNCIILLLGKATFRKVLKRYPDLFYNLQMEMMKMYDKSAQPPTPFKDTGSTSSVLYTITP